MTTYQAGIVPAHRGRGTHDQRRPDTRQEPPRSQTTTSSPTASARSTRPAAAGSPARMVRRALAELPVPLPPNDARPARHRAASPRPAQLADLDRRAASSGGALAEADYRRARIVAAARYALSPQPRAPEEALYEALHARASLSGALDELRHQLD